MNHKQLCTERDIFNNVKLASLSHTNFRLTHEISNTIVVYPLRHNAPSLLMKNISYLDTKILMKRTTLK